MTAPRLKELARSAWHLARMADVSELAGKILSDAWLLEFWSTSRRLAMQWQRSHVAVRQAGFSEANTGDRSRLELLVCEVLIGDFLVRQMATVVEAAATARERELEDESAVARVRPIMQQVVQNVSHVRDSILSQLAADGLALSAADRLRSRCERWTDVLIGPWAVQFGITLYAYDPRRAWDFGEEHAGEEQSPLGQRLLQQSFRAAFRGRLVESPVTSPDLLAVRRLVDDLVEIPVVEPGRTNNRRPEASQSARSLAARDLLEESLRRLLDRDC